RRLERRDSSVRWHRMDCDAERHDYHAARGLGARCHARVRDGRGRSDAPVRWDAMVPDDELGPDRDLGYLGMVTIGPRCGRPERRDPALEWDGVDAHDEPREHRAVR